MINYKKTGCSNCGQKPSNCGCNKKPSPCGKCKKQKCDCHQHIYMQEPSKAIHPIDDKQGMLWNETLVGPAFSTDMQNFLNYQIPFGWVDFTDGGRSNSCKSPGRIYSDDLGNTYIYKDFGVKVMDCSNNVVYEHDNRMPVEALKPYSRCEDGEDNCGEVGCGDNDVESNCPQQALRTICKDGKCQVEWGPALSVKGDGCISLDYDYESHQITASFKLKYEECNTISIEEIAPDCHDCDADCNECSAYKWCVKYQSTCSVTLGEDENGLKADVNLCDTNTVDLECTEPEEGEEGCSGIKANVKYQDTCSVAMSEDENGLKSDVKICDSDSVSLECSTEGEGEDACEGIRAAVKVCDDSFITVTPDGLCACLDECSPLHVDANGCLAWCHDEQTGCLIEDADGNKCYRPKLQTSDFGAAIDPTGNIAPSEAAAFPEIAFSLYADGAIGVPGDAPINAVIDGKCATLIQPISFEDFAQPPYPAPDCMEWHMQITMQFEGANPIPYSQPFAAPITINTTPIINGSPISINGQANTTTGFTWPGFGLALANQQWQVSGNYAALDSGNTAALQIEVCFPEGTGSDVPGVVCLSNKSFLQGSYYLVKKPGAEGDACTAECSNDC